MYVLEKLRLLEGKNSMVGSGYRQSANKLMIFQWPDEKAVEVIDIHDIKVGWQVLVSRGMEFLQTSPVQAIVEKEDNFIVFETKTSVYKLEKVKDE